jgi:hypothetical protein
VTMPSEPSSSFPYAATQPMGYAEPRTRPTSVTSVAIIGIIFGIAGILCIGGSMIWSIAMQGSAQAQKMQMQQTPEMRVFGYVTGGIGFLLSLIVLLGSIGALSLRPWARKLLIGYAVADLIYDTVKLFLVLQWMGPIIVHQMERMPAQQGVDSKKMAEIGKWSMLVTNWLVFGIVAGFAIMILYVMTRPAVVEAFEPRALPGGGVGDAQAGAPAAA